MTHVFVANYCDHATLEAEYDDPSSQDSSLADMASPQVASVSLSLSIDWVKKLQDMVLVELVEDLYEEEDRKTFKWQDMKHATPEHGREHWTMDLTTWDGAELIATIVIQKVEVD